MIVDSSITVRLFAQKRAPTYVMANQKEEGQNQISKRKARVKKRDSIRSRHSRKMDQEIR
ncbi:MAG: hypothetical protein ACMUEL_08420 [Flavobacteriales bacterium Tduv]